MSRNTCRKVDDTFCNLLKYIFSPMASRRQGTRLSHENQV